MTKTALIFMHARHEGPALLCSLLRENEFEVEVVPTFKQPLNGHDPLAPDLLVVMGGPMGVYEATKYPFLKDEIEFLQERLAADRPIFGVCLGAQLIAAALEKPVFKGPPGHEIGWSELILTEAGRNHPVRHLCGNITNMLHWHGDTFDLPDEAVLLASSGLYTNQAYSVGRNTLALQCHPEVVPEQLEEWLDLSAKEVLKSKIVENAEIMRQQSREFITKMNAQTGVFFNEWLEQVGLR